jgi:D-3-phosphoglycerate dehydrogenase
MYKKVLVTPRSFGKISNIPFDMLEKYNYKIIKNDTGNKYSENELIDMVRDVDGLIVGLDMITEKVLRAGRNLKVVTKYGVGLDNIDLIAAKELGIKVTYTPGANSQSVADFTFALMLSLSRSLNKLDKIVRSNNWEKVIGTEIYGKTIGIIGTGAIGKGVAKRSVGFDLKILGYDKYPDYNFAKSVEMKYVDKETLLKNADIISLHVPLTTDMEYFINTEEFKIMKDTAILINTSRGGLINEDALYIALKDNIIAGAALDAFENEPPVNSKLLLLDNILLAPHCGASTVDATNRMGIIAAEGLISILEGKEPRYLWRD